METDKLLNNLVRLLVYASLALVLATSKHHDLFTIRIKHLWVKSPTGKTIKSLPIYTALRVVRNKKWELLDTIPIPTRWQALKYVISGKLSFGNSQAG